MTRNYNYMPRNMTRKSRPKEQSPPQGGIIIFMQIFQNQTTILCNYTNIPLSGYFCKTY